MKSTLQSGPRLPFRIDPVEGESPRGYLCRVAHIYAYDSPFSLVQIAGLSGSGFESDERANRIAYALRLESAEWRRLSYRHIKGRRRFQQRLFLGERISADDLNYRRPRICPACLKEQPIWWASWDLGLVTACPFHSCLLLNRCPSCERRLAWRRSAVHQCRCGVDFRDAPPEKAEADLVAINAAIYRAAGWRVSQAAEINLSSSKFAPEMLRLRLGSLLRLVLFVGSIREEGRLRRKQRPFASTDLAAATEIDRAAVALLREWPHRLREVLRRMLPTEATNPATLSFSQIFGNFYRHLFRVLPRSEFGFLHDMFERFVIEEWDGLIRGQHRYFSADVRRSARWVPANAAEQLARIGGGRILDLVRQGQIEGMFVDLRRGSGRTECWLRRESLNKWITARDAELGRYMFRPEAKDALGLTNVTIVAVARAGAIRHVEGPEQNFPSGFFLFLREDVARIKEAFERHTASVRKYSHPGKLIALRHAMKNYLGRSAGLAAVIAAVVDGELVPAGYTKRFRGITGYLFEAEALRKYRPVPDIEISPAGFLNYGEAAAVLGVERRVVRGLVEQGRFAARVNRNGFAKLIPAKDIRDFAQEYVAAKVTAKKRKVNGGSFARYLRESGITLLKVPLPEKGRYEALFLPKEAVELLKGENVPPSVGQGSIPH